MMTYYAKDAANDMSWDEYRLAVEDEMVIETGDLPSDDDFENIYAAFEVGMTPWGCVDALRVALA